MSTFKYFHMSVHTMSSQLGHVLLLSPLRHEYFHASVHMASSQLGHVLLLLPLVEQPLRHLSHMSTSMRLFTFPIRSGVTSFTIGRTTETSCPNHLRWDPHLLDNLKYYLIYTRTDIRLTLISLVTLIYENWHQIDWETVSTILHFLWNNQQFYIFRNSSSIDLVSTILEMC